MLTRCKNAISLKRWKIQRKLLTAYIRYIITQAIGPSLLLLPVLGTVCVNISRPHLLCLFSVASRLFSSGVHSNDFTATFIVAGQWQLSFSDTLIVFLLYLLTRWCQNVWPWMSSGHPDVGRHQLTRWLIGAVACLPSAPRGPTVRKRGQWMAVKIDCGDGDCGNTAVTVVLIKFNLKDN